MWIVKAEKQFDQKVIHFDDMLQMLLIPCNFTRGNFYFMFLATIKNEPSLPDKESRKKVLATFIFLAPLSSLRVQLTAVLLKV